MPYSDSSSTVALATAHAGVGALITMPARMAGHRHVPHRGVGVTASARRSRPPGHPMHGGISLDIRCASGGRVVPPGHQPLLHVARSSARYGVVVAGRTSVS